MKIKEIIIKWLGGYVGVSDALLAAQGGEKHQILTEAVKHLYNAIGPEDLLREENGRLLFRGQPMTPAEESLLQSEAQQFLNSKLWRILRMDSRWQVNKKMFLEATDEVGMIWGKLMLWYDDCLKSRLKQLAERKISN